MFQDDSHLRGRFPAKCMVLRPTLRRHFKSYKHQSFHTIQTISHYPWLSNKTLYTSYNATLKLSIMTYCLLNHGIILQQYVSEVYIERYESSYLCARFHFCLSARGAFFIWCKILSPVTGPSRFVARGKHGRL